MIIKLSLALVDVYLIDIKLTRMKGLPVNLPFDTVNDKLTFNE